VRVLIADDDPVARLMLDSALRSLGHQVVVTDGGEAAWQELHRHPVRVVVSDWMMPVIDGLELCRRIRTEGSEYTYFILLTGLSASQKNQRTAADAGVDDFLSKPINPQELWRRLRVAERVLEFTKQVSQLESFLPICSYCKQIRDDQNFWQQIESYLSAHAGTAFSHVVCPDCYESQVRPQLLAYGVDEPYPAASAFHPALVCTSVSSVQATTSP
jgi:sigma-B regulation protein RsbU (phosphoserine phosphatase)